MINKKKKKGFTIVELVIVIVIVGVLAAVLIPTFASLIKKANESADKQTVYQMNIIISSELIKNEDLIDEEGTLDIDKFKEILDKNGFDAENLEPTSEDLEFMWDKVNKVVILVRDENGGLTQIYPEANAGDASIADKIRNDEVQDLSTPASPSGDAIATLEDLLAAIESGGSFYLSKSIVIDQNITIKAGTETTINLNGYTLTLEDNTPGDAEEFFDVISVFGNLTLTNGGIIIEAPENGSAYSNHVGIKIADTGALELRDVAVEGNRRWNIENGGSLDLDESVIYVNVGFGVSNNGVADIIDTTFVANGTGVISLYSTGGEADITDSNFIEGDDFVSYNNGSRSPIYASASDLVMDGVEILVNDEDYAFFAKDAEVVIKNASKFDRQFLCTGSTTVAIYGGTFNNGSETVEYSSINSGSKIFEGDGFNLTSDTDDNSVNYWKVSS